MDKRETKLFFALLRSSVGGAPLTKTELESYSREILQSLVKLADKHDITHLLAYALKQNGLIPKENADVEKCIFKALYRYERLKYEYDVLCNALENAGIPFLPLKGSVLRAYYPQPWMRTSCDIDVLVHQEDLVKTVEFLSKELKYVEKERGTHDVSLYSPAGIHVEIHFDLVEEGRAKNAIGVLSKVWENVSLCQGSGYRYEMSDAFFYFYHVAHMAKHFEDGGCGIRPFLDLWILDQMQNVDFALRDDLLSCGGLLEFANACRDLSRVWLAGAKASDLSNQMQTFLLHGGVYGSPDNRVALKQSKKGGRLGYIFSRVFIPMEKLRRYYPVLNRHPYLMPLMQIRRWFMLLNPDVASMAKSEILANGNMEKSKADKMNVFLNNIGL